MARPPPTKHEGLRWHRSQICMKSCCTGKDSPLPCDLTEPTGHPGHGQPSGILNSAHQDTNQDRRQWAGEVKEPALSQGGQNRMLSPSVRTKHKQTNKQTKRLKYTPSTILLFQHRVISRHFLPQGHSCQWTSCRMSFFPLPRFFLRPVPEK